MYILDLMFPWLKTSASPVEINIKNVYILFVLGDLRLKRAIWRERESNTW